MPDARRRCTRTVYHIARGRGAEPCLYLLCVRACSFQRWNRATLEGDAGGMRASAAGQGYAARTAARCADYGDQHWLGDVWVFTGVHWAILRHDFLDTYLHAGGE
jgi:hypothetical protein